MQITIEKNFKHFEMSLSSMETKGRETKSESSDIESHRLNKSRLDDENILKANEQQNFIIGNLFPNSAVEPFCVANPHHKKIIAATYQQSRWSEGGSIHCPVAISFDEGKKWTHYTLKTPDLSPGKLTLVSDPWLSFRSDGEYLFQIALVFDITNVPNGVLVRRAKVNREKEALEWCETVILQTLPDASLQTDKSSITCDSHNHRFVYAVWQLFKLSDSTSTLAFARSCDGGEKFESSRVIYDASKDISDELVWAGVNSSSIVNPIIISLKKITLCFFARYYAVGNEIIHADIAYIESEDQGKTWSSKAKVAASPFLASDAVEPDATILNAANPSKLYRTGSFLFSIASSYDKLCIAYQQGVKTPQVFLSFSSDYGKCWSKQGKKANRSEAQAFLPCVAILEDRIFLNYYDFRNYSGKSGSKLLTDVWLSEYKFPKESKELEFVKERQLTKKSFDFRRTPVAQGYFVGDYNGICAGKDKIHCVFGVGKGREGITKTESVKATEVTHPRLSEITYASVCV
jgi:hypothetical protein